MNNLKVNLSKKLIVHSETGDPVFSYDKDYQQGMFRAKWHPAMKHIYGDRLSDSISMVRAERVLDNTPQKLANKVLDFYNTLSDKNIKTDILKTKKTSHENGDYHHDIFSDDGERIATMKSNKFSDFSISVVVPEEHQLSWELYKRKHYIQSDDRLSPTSAMEHIANWNKQKDVKPSFIGLHMHDNVKTYSTHLPDDVAAEKYTNHVAKINKIIGRQHTIEKLSPTDYRIHVPLTNSDHEHLINVKNGLVTHTENRSLGKVHYDSKPLDQIIE